MHPPSYAHHGTPCDRLGANRPPIYRIYPSIGLILLRLSPLSLHSGASLYTMGRYNRQNSNHAVKRAKLCGSRSAGGVCRRGAPQAWDHASSPFTYLSTYLLHTHSLTYPRPLGMVPSYLRTTLFTHSLTHSLNHSLTPTLARRVGTRTLAGPSRALRAYLLTYSLTCTDWALINRRHPDHP